MTTRTDWSAGPTIGNNNWAYGAEIGVSYSETNVTNANLDSSNPFPDKKIQINGPILAIQISWNNMSGSWSFAAGAGYVVGMDAKVLRGEVAGFAGIGISNDGPIAIANGGIYGGTIPVFGRNVGMGLGGDAVYTLPVQFVQSANEPLNHPYRWGGLGPVSPNTSVNGAIGSAVQDGSAGTIWDPRLGLTQAQLRDALYGGGYSTNTSSNSTPSSNPFNNPANTELSHLGQYNTGGGSGANGGGTSPTNTNSNFVSGPLMGYQGGTGGNQSGGGALVFAVHSVNNATNDNQNWSQHKAA